MNYDVLIIDDEAPIRKLLNITLQTEHFSVAEAATAKQGIQLARQRNPDLILLDLGLPDLDGREVLSKLREWFTKPVIILSVKNSEDEIIACLDAGANDYLVKPFRTGELLARIRAALRRSMNTFDEDNYENGALNVNMLQRAVTLAGKPVKLTATEFDLLHLLIRNEGRVLTHQFLLSHIWGPGYVSQVQYLRVFVAQLRKKVETDPLHPRLIITESGVGYRFAAYDDHR